MLAVLAGVAEFERELIWARASEGRQWAKARGVKLGRKFKLTPHQRKEALPGAIVVLPHRSRKQRKQATPGVQ